MLFRICSYFTRRRDFRSIRKKISGPAPIMRIWPILRSENCSRGIETGKLLARDRLRVEKRNFIITQMVIGAQENEFITKPTRRRNPKKSLPGPKIHSLHFGVE